MEFGMESELHYTELIQIQIELDLIELNKTSRIELNTIIKSNDMVNTG